MKLYQTLQFLHFLLSFIPLFLLTISAESESNRKKSLKNINSFILTNGILYSKLLLTNKILYSKLPQILTKIFFVYNYQNRLSQTPPLCSQTSTVKYLLFSRDTNFLHRFLHTDTLSLNLLSSTD